MNKKQILAAGAIVAGVTWWQAEQKWKVVKGLKYFSPDEWRGQWGLLSSTLLKRLDRFRDLYGRPVMISPAAGALFRVRPTERAGNSWHYFGMAADVMLPYGLDAGNMEIISAAKAAGFTGIGLYPHWQPYAGLHLDVRPDVGDPPAYWAGINPDGAGQRYVSLAEGLKYVQT